jgi:hypothetical protein
MRKREKSLSFIEDFSAVWTSSHGENGGCIALIVTSGATFLTDCEVITFLGRPKTSWEEVSPPHWF